VSQHDYDIANQTAPNFRSDLNDALEAIATNNAGASAPSTTYANQWWYDTSNNILKIRSKADDAWINVGYLDQSTNEFKPYIGATQITAFLDEDDMSSDSATAIPSQQSVKAYVDGRVQTTFDSSQFTPSAGGLQTIAHGLGAAPRHVTKEIICTTADSGFSVGDRVLLPVTTTFMDANTGSTVTVDAANIYVRFGNSDLEKVITPDGSRNNLTYGSWDMIVRATL